VEQPEKSTRSKNVCVNTTETYERNKRRTLIFEVMTFYGRGWAVLETNAICIHRKTKGSRDSQQLALQGRATE
jgi:hypothetical protein